MSSTLRSSTTRECLESKTSPPTKACCSTRGSSIASSCGVSSIGVLSSSILNVQVLYEFCVRLNKVFAQLHLCSHQLREDGIGFLGIGHFNLNQYALLGVHGGFKQLLSIH